MTLPLLVTAIQLVTRVSLCAMLVESSATLYRTTTTAFLQPYLQRKSAYPLLCGNTAE